MTGSGARKDLVVLVPDKNMEAAVRQLLARPESLSTRGIAHDVFVHVERDPGCLLHAHDLLALYSNRYTYALVLLDHEGCGQESRLPKTLEEELVNRLEEAGWKGRAAAILIHPELEAWVWSDSPHVRESLRWPESAEELRARLVSKGLWKEGQDKPHRPKECVEYTLRYARHPRSSALYATLAAQVGLNRCVDPAFAKLKQTLQQWFPLSE